MVIGQDTRQSSAWIADRVTHGLTSSGIEVHSAGRDHHAGRGLPGALAQIRRRRGHFGVAQSLDRQWHQGFLRRRLQVAGRARDRHRTGNFCPAAESGSPRGLVFPASAEPAGAGRTAPRLHRMAGEECGRRSEPVASAGGLRQWRGRGGGAGIVSPVRHPRDVSQRGPGRPEHQRQLRRTAS